MTGDELHIMLVRDRTLHVIPAPIEYHEYRASELDAEMSYEHALGEHVWACARCPYCAEAVHRAGLHTERELWCGACWRGEPPAKVLTYGTG